MWLFPDTCVNRLIFEELLTFFKESDVKFASLIAAFCAGYAELGISALPYINSMISDVKSRLVAN